MHLNATCNDRTETQQFPFTVKQQMKENGGGGGGGRSPVPSSRPTRGFTARAILPCIGPTAGWFVISVASGFTDSARVWTPSTMTC